MSSRASLLLRLVFIPVATLAALVFVLTRDGYSYGRLAGLVAAFVIAADLVTFCKGRLQNALLLVATIFLGLAVLEAVAQTILPHRVFSHSNGLFGDRAELGWGPTKAGSYPVELDIDGKPIYKVTYTIDDTLLRHVETASDGPKIAFFGDSFTFGDGLDDADTLPQKFSDLAPGIRVLNLAFSAYSPAQMLRELQVGLFDTQLKGSRLFVLQTGPFHVERIACKTSFSLRGPRFVEDGDQLAYKGPCTSGLWRRVKEFTAETALDRVFVSPMTRRPSHDDVITYVHILAAIGKLSRDKYGVPLVLLYVNSPDEQLTSTGFTNGQIRALIEKAGIHLLDTDVDSKPDDVLRIPGDGHPTGRYNHLIAEKLVADLKATMPDVLTPQK